nr:RNA-directed DNA polymerase, eukaryota, reverse transcriptase zinc-binding domain protein [Tanacetum cinerariifolium]
MIREQLVFEFCNRLTKEDDVAKISTSIFVTNFPESFSAKDLLQSCKQYGHVVDTFIPNKRSKADKRFGFVRFINVFNDERLVNNLCTIWNDHLKLHANITRFNRAPLKENNIREKEERSMTLRWKGELFGLKLKVYWIRAKEVLGWISEIMEVSDDDEQSVEDVKGGDTVVHDVGNHGEDSDVDEQRKVNSHGDMVNGESLKYPPGFTPIDATKMMGQSNENVEKQNGNRDHNNNVEEPLNGRDDCSDNMGIKPNDLDSGCSGRFKKSMAPRTGGSILCLMEEVVKETKMESMELITIKSCWGNYAFDYVHSDAVGANLLIVAVYAPHDLKDKCLLWDYLTHAELIRLKGELQAVDGDIDYGNGSDKVVSKRTEIINSMLRLNKIKASKAAQKAKIKWSVEKDENLIFFHGMLNKNRSQLSIRGVMADGVWIENPNLVKDEFVQHFSSRFGKPTDIRASIDMNFPKVLSTVQKGGAGMQILDGPFILNEVMHWCTVKKKQALIFKVDFEKAYNSVRWDFLDEVLQKFSFGNKWRMWIQSSLKSSRGSILVNGSPTEEFQFYKGNWNDSNINTLVNVLECFYRASGLRINMCKSKIMGVHVEGDLVKHAASKLGCLILSTSFVYLGTKVGGKMSRVKEWNEVVDKVVSRYIWSLEGSGDFSVVFIRKVIDDKFLPNVISKTRWVICVPIKVNILALKVKMDALSVRKAAKLKKQMNAKLAWINEKYNHRSETHIGGSSSQTHEIGDVYLIAEELHQLHLDEEALRETLEEQTIDEKAREEKIRQKQADDNEYFMEFGLDIDNSNIHLTPVLRSSSSAHVEPSPYTPNPVTIIPGPAVVVQLSNSICDLPQPQTQLGYPDVGENADFNSGAWVIATNYVNAFGGTVTGCLGDIDNFLKKEKLEQVVAVVKSCSPNALGDLNVTLKDLSDEYMKISERSSRTALDHFCEAVMEIYGPEFLRKPPVTDIEKLYRHHEEKHGFSGMLGSLNCTDWECYPSRYYLIDGIYPELAPLIYTIPEPADDDHKRILYKQKQESARKDVEQAFGVLKKKWAVLANPTRVQKKKELLV